MGMVVKNTLTYPTGRVIYRRTFPVELRPFVPGREFKVPLGQRGEAGLLTRYEAAEAEYNAITGKARRQLAGHYDDLDGPTIAYLAEVFRVEALQDDEEARWSSDERDLYSQVRRDLEARGIPAVVGFKGREAGRWAEKTRQTLMEQLPRYRQLRAEGDLDGILAIWATDALDLLEAQSLMIRPDAVEPLRRLCRALNDAAVAAGEARLARLDGADVPTPAEPERLSVLRAATVPAVAAVRLLETFDGYATAKQMTPGVRLDWRRMVSQLVDFLGHDDAARLTTEDLMRWRDQLLAEPTQGGKRRDPVTVKSKYIASVKAMLGWAVQERKLPVNVAVAVVVHVPKKAKLRERDFTNEEATAILRAALVPASALMAPGHALARRWIPWLCAYTGARVNEFSQLRGEDVIQFDGIWAVRITPEAGTVKAKAARIVPLHPHLIEQGFLEAIKARGQGPLFYDPGRLRVAKEGNRHFKKVGERLAEWVRKEVGIVDPAVQPNHGWRHMFKTRAFSAGVQERIVDAIQGHAPATVSRSYGSVPVPDMAKAIEKMPRFDVDPGSAR